MREEMARRQRERERERGGGHRSGNGELDEREKNACVGRVGEKESGDDWGISNGGEMARRRTYQRRRSHREKEPPALSKTKTVKWKQMLKGGLSCRLI